MHQSELAFSTGDVIYVYGDMDEDGFFFGELHGLRGLVPSNFLTEAPPDYAEGQRRTPHGAPMQAKGEPRTLPPGTGCPSQSALLSSDRTYLRCEGEESSWLICTVLSKTKWTAAQHWPRSPNRV